MKKILKTQTRNHFRAFQFLVINIIVSIVAVWYFRFDQTSIVLFSAYLSLILIPVSLLHLEYYFNDKDNVIEVFDAGIKIHNKKTNYESILNIHDIKKIIVYRSANFDKIALLPTELYFYAKVFTHSEDNSVVITSLTLSNSCEELSILKNISIEFKGTFLPSIAHTISGPNLNL